MLFSTNTNILCSAPAKAATIKGKDKGFVYAEQKVSLTRMEVIYANPKYPYKAGDFIYVDSAYSQAPWWVRVYRMGSQEKEEDRPEVVLVPADAVLAHWSSEEA